MFNNTPNAGGIPPSFWQRLYSAVPLLLAFLGAMFGGTVANVPSCRPSSPPVVVPPVVVPPAPPCDPPPPMPMPPPSDPKDAIVKVQFGNAGCSATAIGRPLPDGRQQFLCAAHCFKGTPRQGVAMFRNGRTIRVVLQGAWEDSDCAWLISELPESGLPALELATVPPKKGDAVFHAGFGFDKPGNVEAGEVVTPDNGQGQTEYFLNVSNGDSGGGIALTAEGKVLSPVCCTTAVARKARVWGATVEECRKRRPLPTPVAEEWNPIPIPIRNPEP